MASSPVDIYNQALLIIGASPIVKFDSSDDASVEQQVGAVMYDSIKRQLLRAYPWRCATKNALLALLTDKPLDPQWEFAFALPNDSIRILDIIPNTYVHSDKVEWAVEGQTILTRNLNGAVAKYIYDVPEPQMDSHVEMALVAQLAMDTAYAFTASQGRETALAQMLSAKIQEARTTDRQEGSSKRFQIDTLSVVRY